MQIPTEVKKLSGFAPFLKENRFFAISFLFVFAGMLAGALSVSGLGDGYLGIIEDYLSSYMSFRTDNGFMSVFFNVLISGLGFIFIIGASAFGVNGLIALPVFCFARGFGTCALSGILYRNYGLRGIAFANLILLPSCLITDFIIMYSAGEAMKLSWRFFELIRDVSSRGITVRPVVGVLLRKCGYSVIAVVISSAVEAAFTTSFIKYFIFV